MKDYVDLFVAALIEKRHSKKRINRSAPDHRADPGQAQPELCIYLSFPARANDGQVHNSMVPGEREEKMKNIKQIENIFWNFEKLNEEYADLPETKKASEELINFLIGNGMTEEEYMEVEDFISNATVQHEKQGFIYGFQYAVKLLFGEINEGR